MTATATRSKLFWTGGSQAVRLPKTMRLPGSEVLIRRKGRAIVISATEDQDSWEGFWDAFEPMDESVGLRRWPTGPAEVREPM
jgi:virulence-associated protein VagC